MTILAADEVMLREPNLHVKHGRPVSLVRCNLPGKVLFAHLFREAIDKSFGYTVTKQTGNFTSLGYVIYRYDDNPGTAVGNLGTANWTLLVDVTVPSTAALNYHFIAGSNYPNGFGIAFRHIGYGNKWGILVAGTDYQPTGNSVLPLQRHVFGLSRTGAGTLAVALNGKSFDTITFGDTGAALNGLWFNSSDDADSDNGCAAGTTYHAAILLQNGFSAETLADWTSDSANWWTPA